MIRLGRAAASRIVHRTAVGLVCLAAAASGGCLMRPTSEDLRKQVADLQQENFQLRKDLTEARVRLEMQKERAAQSGAGPEQAAPPAAPAGPDEGASGGATAASNAPRVIYSEPITDRAHTRAGMAAAGGGGAGNVERMLRSGRERLDAKDPDGALAIFRQIVDRYPADALADDAQFGAGECYFQMGRYEDAITEYQKVVNNFPYGDQVPFAFLKIGFAHLAREQRDLALDDFKTVSEAYPGTEAATIARQQIAHLTRH